jgi:2-C-methyl-D-erythritol 4-phosphate cytidylyltransferase
MVVEYYNRVPAHMVMGSYYNIKVTTPEDLVLGKAILDDLGY